MTKAKFPLLLALLFIVTTIQSMAQGSNDSQIHRIAMRVYDQRYQADTFDVFTSCLV